MKYYQLSFTLDKSVRGKFEMPHTISIESPNFLKYISEKSKNITMYFENRMDLYENMPDNLIGKLLKRKNVIDFMDFTPACLSLIAVVSNKIKRILEHLDVSRNEYVLKRITVKDFSDDFYLLFLPIIPDTEFVAHYSPNMFSEILFYILSLYINYLRIFSFGLHTHKISRF